MDRQDWVFILDNGMAVCALVFVAYAVCKAVMWLAVNMLVPLRDAVTSFLDATKASITKISEAMDNQTDVLEEMSATLKSLHARLDRIERGPLQRE